MLRLHGCICALMEKGIGVEWGGQKGCTLHVRVGVSVRAWV